MEIMSRFFFPDNEREEVDRAKRDVLLKAYEAFQNKLGPGFIEIGSIEGLNLIASDILVHYGYLERGTRTGNGLVITAKNTFFLTDKGRELYKKWVEDNVVLDKFPENGC